MMDQDNITWTGARNPGVERRMSLELAVLHRAGVSDSVRRVHAAAEGTKDGGKLVPSDGDDGSNLNRRGFGEGLAGQASFVAVPRETPPYGILGGTMETAASFEARYAPSSYPTVADDVRRREVGPRNSSCEAGEQRGAIRCGVGGAKDGDQGECGPTKQTPGSGLGKGGTSAGPHTTSCKAKEEGTVSLASPPRQRRSAPPIVLRIKEGRGTRGRRPGMAGLRDKPRGP